MTYTLAVSPVFSAVRRAALCALLGLCFLAGLLPQACASTVAPIFTVTRTADDTAPGSLRSAIAQAAAVNGTINFQIPTSDPGYRVGSPGTVTITLARGPLVIPSSLSIVGPNVPSATVVVLGSLVAGQQSRVFSVTGGTVSISSLNIQQGRASPANVTFPESDGGGGILNTANLTLTNCVVSANSSGADGGGINNSGAGATLTLNGTNVGSNRIDSGGGGGGIANSGTLIANARTSIGNNAVFGGSSSGGGLFNTGTATINGGFLFNNAAVFYTPGAGGGGAYNRGSLTLNNCYVSGNSTYGSGGGVDNVSGAALILNACTVLGNAASSYPLSTGGGISNAGAAQVTNCLFANNTSDNVGGINNGGSLTLINSTFAANRTQGGAYGSGPQAGALLSGPATLLNDIFYFDTTSSNDAASTTVSEIVAAPGTTGPTVTYCDVQGGYPGTGNINADPQFFENPDPGSEGDTNGDEHLQATSPAVRAGTNGPGVPVTDIEGTPRPTPPARPSMGAYEVPGSAAGFSAQGGFTVTGTQNQSTGTQIVAKFLPGTTPVAGFLASINFGDGSGPMPGTISADPTANGVYQVTGSHTYTTPGTFPVTVTISGPGGAPTATVTSSAIIQPILAGLTFPASVPGGTVVSATVSLSGVTSSDVVVSLSSSDSSVVRIFRSVIVPAGSSSGTFAINTFRSHFPQMVTVQATLGSVTLTKDLTITVR